MTERSRTLYTQVDTRALIHPDWFEAGWDAMAAFLAIDGQLREFPNAGYLPPSHAKPAILLARVAATGFTADYFGELIDRLAAVGMIDLDEDGGIYLPKWEERGHREKAPKSAADRKREQRKRDRAKGLGSSHEAVTTESRSSHDPVTPESRDVTHPSPSTSPFFSGTEHELDHPPIHPSSPSESYTSAVPPPSAEKDGRTDGVGSGSDPGPTRSTAGLDLAAVAASCRASEHPPDRSGVPRRGGAERVRRAVG